MPDQHDHTHQAHDQSPGPGGLAQSATELAESASVIGVPPDLLEALASSGPEEGRRLEEASVAATDNGWQEGDPVEQPENPEPWGLQEGDG